jgi:hypothetical protein
MRLWKRLIYRNIRKIAMHVVVPCFHSLDGHYRRMDQALERGEGNQGAMRRRLSGSQQQKWTERDKRTGACFVYLVLLVPSIADQPILGQ